MEEMRRLRIGSILWRKMSERPSIEAEKSMQKKGR